MSRLDSVDQRGQPGVGCPAVKCAQCICNNVTQKSLQKPSLYVLFCSFSVLLSYLIILAENLHLRINLRCSSSRKDHCCTCIGPAVCKKYDSLGLTVPMSSQGERWAFFPILLQSTNATHSSCRKKKWMIRYVSSGSLHQVLWTGSYSIMNALLC